MTDYISGSSGFLGSHLKKRLPDAICISHEELDWPFLADRFFFLSAYGNMSFQQKVYGMVTANVLDVLGAYSKSHSFIFVSTSSVNLKIQTPYSRTKRAAEEILLAHGDACIIRPYSITGVGEQKEHLIPTLIRSCLSGERLDFVPWAKHDYIDVDDVVDAILNLADHPGIYEVGSGRGYSNQQVLGFVEDVTGRKANINVVDSLRPYDTVDWLCPNISARKWGWKPKKDLVDSITEMVERERIGA